MNGLLKKDLLVLKGNGKAYAFLLLFYVVFSFFSSSTFFSSMVMIFLVILPLSSFSTDELARWDKFAAALPGGRRAVVKSKYQFLFLTLAGMVVLSGVINLFIFLLDREGGSFFKMMLTALVCAGIGLLVNCLFYPFLFKYGAQKGRIFLLLTAGIIGALFAVSVVILIQDKGTLLHMLFALSPVVIIASAVVLLAAAAVISYCVSLRIYDKKEF